MAATGLGLSGASSVRQPEGAGKWFAESRARRALRSAGFRFNAHYIVKGELPAYGRLYRGNNGLHFELTREDPQLENIAYTFGASVKQDYS